MSKAKHIGVFGRRNSGKSSLINLISGQEVAIVSPKAGTTTDPVRKRMELPKVGITTLIDTAGVDDVGHLGEQRVAKTKEIISQIDLALLLYTNNELGFFERELIERFKEEELPFILIHNQSDIIALNRESGKRIEQEFGVEPLEFSCSYLEDQEEREAIEILLELISERVTHSPYRERGLFEGLLESGNHIVLVTPIDEQAPEGRLILPQVNAIREILDRGATAVVLQPENLVNYIEEVAGRVDLVVTDSQVFDRVDKMVPSNIPLTGFSLLLARAKGSFENYLEGTPTIDSLKEGDRVLILESCSHHSSCEDIGRVKIPAMLNRRSGVKIEWDIVAGLDPIPEDLSKYSLVIQCGGCMITNRQLAGRLRGAIRAGIPVTNYGMTLAWCMGIYNRATELFRENR